VSHPALNSMKRLSSPCNLACIAALIAACGGVAHAAPAGQTEAVASGECVAGRPAPEDERCGEFGWNPRVQATVPVAWPQIMDLTPRGALETETVRLSDSIAERLNLAGAFAVQNRDAVPTGGVITWASPIAFDYLGWREAGNWMVVTGTLEPAGRDTYRASFMTYLTEEGDVLQISGALTVDTMDGVVAFAGRYVDAVASCITGLPGMLDTRLVYARKLPGGHGKEIWMTDLGSGTQTQVSSDGSLALLPAWAPGGSVAWTGYALGNPDLYLNGRKFGDRPGMNTGIAFSPDGRFAAVTWGGEAASDIYLLDPVNGRELSRLTTSRGNDMSPAWSPDSNKMAFVSDRQGFPNVFVMNSDGTDQSPLPVPGNYNTGPDWSPDGTTIVYQSRGENSRFSIWTFNVDTGAIRRISRDRYNNEEPSWSADGRFIVYTSSRNGRKQLFIMNADGSGARPVFSDDSEYFTPAWERRIPAAAR